MSSDTADTTTIVDLPATFYEDHVSRELPAGKVIEYLPRNKVRVELTADERAEILSDAEHYADWCGGGLDRSYIGLVSSARATVKALS